jgi:hypothetical protein
VCVWVCVPQVRGEGVRGEGSVCVWVCVNSSAAAAHLGMLQLQRYWVPHALCLAALASPPYISALP